MCVCVCGSGGLVDDSDIRRHGSWPRDIQAGERERETERERQTETETETETERERLPEPSLPASFHLF